MSHEESHETHQHSVASSSTWSWGRGILEIIVLALIYLLFSHGCQKSGHYTEEELNEKVGYPGASNSVSAPADLSAKESIKVTLPNGKVLDAYKGGIEDQLVAFLKTDYKSLGADSLKNIWFNFDNLNFATASANILPASQVQIDNLAAILKAFPASKIKIGGYTDKTGDEAKNLSLSKGRAASVQAALAKAGVGAQVIGADGYGSQYAQVPATASEEERIADRHVSVSVRL